LVQCQRPLAGVFLPEFDPFPHLSILGISLGVYYQKKCRKWINVKYHCKYCVPEKLDQMLR
jgi:hypothetical protein